MLGFAKGSVGSAWSPPWKYKRCHYYVFHQPGGGSAVGGERVEICVPGYCGGAGFRVGISCSCGDFVFRVGISCGGFVFRVGISCSTPSET